MHDRTPNFPACTTLQRDPSIVYTSRTLHFRVLRLRSDWWVSLNHSRSASIHTTNDRELDVKLEPRRVR